MSEGSISVSKAKKIIAVTWVLSLVTTLAVVFFVPVLQPKTWHELQHWSGTFEEADDPWEEEIDRKIGYVTISADNWRISWKVNCHQTPPPDNVLFYIAESTTEAFYPRHYVTQEDFRDATGGWAETDKGIEYLVGSGYRQIIVRGTMVSWEITIEEYY